MNCVRPQVHNLNVVYMTSIAILSCREFVPNLSERQYTIKKTPIHNREKLVINDVILDVSTEDIEQIHFFSRAGFFL